MITRREFIAGATLGAAVFAGTSSFSCQKQSKEKSLGTSQSETIILGRTGLKVSRVGFGAALFTRDKTKEEAVRFAHNVLDNGIDLIDTAWNYGSDQASWKVLGEVFKNRNRDEFILSNKLEWREERAISQKSVEGQIDESLKILNVDYIDIYHIHNVLEPGSYEFCVRKRYIEDFVKMREKGKIRFIGITGHSHPEMIQMCKHYPEIDVVMGGMNVMREFFFFDCDARHLNDYAQRNNLGILIMKPIVAGSITSNQPAALKYTMTQPMSVPIPGMSEIEQIIMNVKAAQEFSALSAEEQKKWRDPETVLECTACTGCKYCINGETDDIDVPQLVIAAQYGERFGMKAWQSKDKNQKKLSRDLEKVTPDMAKRYARKCPLELPVEELLEKSAKYV